ncbi:MAG: ElyC/SanA/YdcF family protein [Nanoarchaeota archaeon]
MNKQEIFVVFGKELKNDSITFEYKDRIDRMIDHFNMMGYLSNEKNMMPENSKILFTGGQKINGNFTEARLGHSYFETKLSKGGIILPKEIIELDIDAKNTMENIENVLEMLDKNSEIFLHLISTDYHIDRLENGDRLLCKNGSLISKIRKINGLSYGFLRSRYRYLSDDDEIKRWQAQLYLDSENFKIMESNLISIVNGEITELLKPVVDCFPKNLDKIGETFRIMIGSKNTKNDKVDEVIDKVYPILSILRNFHTDIIDFVNKSNGAKRINEWENKYNIFKETLRELILTVDPDEPITNGFLRR